MRLGTRIERSVAVGYARNTLEPEDFPSAAESSHLKYDGNQGLLNTNGIGKQGYATPRRHPGYQ